METNPCMERSENLSLMSPTACGFKSRKANAPLLLVIDFGFKPDLSVLSEATTERLGPITLLYTDDAVPPDIQLTIGNQQHFVPGGPNRLGPLIGATLTDPSGLDYLTRPLLLEIGDSFGEYERIDPEAYQVTHHPGSNQLVLTYPVSRT